MFVSNINFSKYPTFQSNPNSPKLKFVAEDFFVKIRGYGKDKNWANQIIQTADAAVKSLRANVYPEYVLQQITSGVAAANMIPFDIEKRIRTGILRTERKGWDDTGERVILTGFEKGRYHSYAQKLNHRYKNPLKPINKDIGMSVITKYQDILHGKPELINNALDYVINLTKELFPKFIRQNVKTEDMNYINATIAEIRWVMAHATPWLRGSDAISNVFMRAMYKALGIKTYPLAKGVSLDLEAYCTELVDYKKNFVTYFEKTPVIVD